MLDALSEPFAKDSFQFEKNKLRSLMFRHMIRAKREGIWFRLSRGERSLYSLALNLKVRLQSYELLKAIVSILKRMLEMGNNLYTALTKGAKLAWNFSDFAISWGNQSASAWRHDRNYILYLGINNVSGKSHIL